jgi:type I restriction enzyme S subunit
MSLPRYPRYKDSGVEWLGEVPFDWKVSSLRRVISQQLSNGIFKKKEDFGQGVPLVNVLDVYRDDFKVNFDSLVWIIREG